MTDKAPIRLKFNAPRAPASAPRGAPAPASRAPAPSALAPDPAPPQQCKTCNQKIIPKPKPPLHGTEALVVKCGHTIVFDLYVKDPFRAGRRAKEAGRVCLACRQAREQAEIAAAAEKKAAKQAEYKRARAPLKPRLPDGARFSSIYDATKIQWTGSLAIDGVTFEQTADSLRKLLIKLDDAYRKSLPVQEDTHGTWTVQTFDENTLRGSVSDGQRTLPFHSTSFRAARALRWPRVGESVELVFNNAGALLSVEAP